MAVLEKIRVKFGIVASIIIALGLLSFIIDPNEVISAFQSMSSRNDVGNINGKAISYTDFQEENDKMTKVNEIMSGSSVQSADQQGQVRNATWQDLIYRYLFVKKARAAGINVGDDEIVDLTTGSNPSPLIAQNPVFLDENGNFSKEQVVKFVQAISSDQTGNLKTYWQYLQNSIINQQYFEKYNALFSAGNVDNALTLKKKIEENNTTANVDFVMVPFGYEMDSTIVVSDSEVKKFYNSHKKFFKQPASRDIEYVVYEVEPSESDIAKAKQEVAEIYNDFVSTDNMKNFLMKNSDRPYSEYWYKVGELRTIAPAIEDFVWKYGASVSDILTKDNTFYIAKVMNTKMIPDSAYVKHILLQGENSDKKADSLLMVLKKGENFANVAAFNSADTRSAADGQRGNLGWMTQNYMLPGFESVLTAPIGVPYIVKTQYGTHIVEVTKKTSPIVKKQVAIYEKEAFASKETFNEYYSRANKFATAAAGSYANYKKAVDTLGVYSHTVNAMLENSDKLGAIENTKEITRWAFENKAGKVSDIKTIDNKYFFIVTVKAVHKEGYAGVSEVSSSIRQQLYQDKLALKKVAEVAEKIKGLEDMSSIAEKLGTTVSSQSGLAFSSMNSYGLDPKFIGAVASAKEGVISTPVAGSIGTYVFKVTGRDTGAFYTEDDAKNRDAQMSQYLSQMIIPVMMQDADVKDNRARFF